MDKVLVLAHRGRHGSGVKENTIEAFASALDSGADGVELDVHATRDGRLVVSHDPDLKRVYGVEGRIRGLTFEQIRDLAPGIASLEEVFQAFGGIFYDIEIKADPVTDTGACPLLAALLEKFHADPARMMVSSFNPLVMRRFHRLAPAFPTAVIYDAMKTTPFYLRRGQGRLFFHCDFLNPRADIAAGQMERHPSYRFAPWNVNDAETASALIGKGAEILITDDVLLLKSLF